MDTKPLPSESGPADEPDTLPSSERTTIDFSRPDQLVGQCLEGRFFIEKNLTSTGADVGGIGVVFLANDEKLLGRRVVVKVLNDDALKFGDMARKFLHEKEALIRLDHPGIVKILDSGTLNDGNPFIVMEYINGESLRKALQRQQVLPLHLAAHLIRSLTDALSAAHAQRVLHRDIKPENIMLTPVDGDFDRLRLIDFGIAKVGDSQLAPETQISRAIGTVLYMAPEQLIGRADITPAADIYSAGTVVFELLTGDLPFKPRSMAEMYQLQSQGVKTRPGRLRPDLPTEAEALLLSALEFDPDKRPQNARKFGRDLANALTDGKVFPPISISDDDSMHSIKTEYAAGSDLARQIQELTLPGTEVVDVAPLTRENGRSTGVSRPGPRFWITFGLIGMIVLGLGTGVGIYLTQRLTNIPAGQPVPTSTEQPNGAAFDVEISYYLIVQRIQNHKPFGGQIQTGGKDMFFNSQDQYVVYVTSDHDGYIYLFNEGPDDAGKPVFTQMFPSKVRDNLNAHVPPGQTVRTGTGEFGEGTGNEKNWLIWTRGRMDELESIIKTAQPPYGRLTAAGSETLRAFLEAHRNEPRLPLATGEDRVAFRGSGDVVVDRFELKHR